jgi:hypothetical protein
MSSSTLAPPFEAPPFTTTSLPTLFTNNFLLLEDAVAVAFKSLKSPSC